MCKAGRCGGDPADPESFAEPGCAQRQRKPDRESRFLLTVLSPFPVRDRIRSAVCRIRVSPFSDAGSSDRGTDIRLLSRLHRFYCGRTGFTLPDGRLFRALPVTGTTSDAQTAQCPETVRSRNSDTVSKHSSFCCETKWRGRMD